MLQRAERTGAVESPAQCGPSVTCPKGTVRSSSEMYKLIFFFLLETNLDFFFFFPAVLDAAVCCENKEDTCLMQLRFCRDKVVLVHYTCTG